MGTLWFTKALMLLAFRLLVASESRQPTPGHCPPVFQTFAPAKPCVHDEDCNKGEKCCVYFGKPVCAPAEIRLPGCPSTHGLFGICVELCSSDLNCSINEKCCSNGCGHQCMRVRS